MINILKEIIDDLLAESILSPIFDFLLETPLSQFISGSICLFLGILLNQPINPNIIQAIGVLFIFFAIYIFYVFCMEFWTISLIAGLVIEGLTIYLSFINKSFIASISAENDTAGYIVFFILGTCTAIIPLFIGFQELILKNKYKNKYKNTYQKKYKKKYQKQHHKKHMKKTYNKEELTEADKRMVNSLVKQMSTINKNKSSKNKKKKK